MKSMCLLVGAAVIASGCSKTPYTNRGRVNAVPDALMHRVGQQTYAATLQDARVVDGEDARTLRRVGQRIARSANEPGYDWSFALLDEETMNAWCLPGGYIAFYRGILPVLESEAGMAIVMGHEAAHATAKHGSERLTQQLGVVGGLTLLQAWIDGRSKLDPSQKEMLFAALGVGAEVGIILPFSRLHESEADSIGLMYAASAGYPPEESIAVWERMDALGGERPPEFVSTHPSPSTRIANLREWMPRAMKRYRRNKLTNADETLRPLWTNSGVADAR